MELTWKIIPNYSKYLVSDNGHVYSLETEQFLCGIITKSGYIRVSMKRDDGIFKNEFVHKLVLSAFVGPRPHGMICRHYPDQNRQNNKLSNLSYSNQVQNNYDRIENGTYNQATLTPEDVINIKTLLALGKSDVDIRNAGYNISAGILSNIRHNKIWKNIGPDISNIEYRRGGGQKLNIDQVREIKQMLNSKQYTQTQIAAKFNIDQSAVSNIKNGKAYSDVV